MADTIKNVASMAMTAFYQGLRPSNGALRIEHFIWLCVAADSKIKQDEYKEQVNLRLRMRQFDAALSMSADNYTSVEVEVKNEKAKLPYPIMSFAGDSSSLGVEDVKPVGQCPSFIRINPEEDWMVCKIKDVVFWKPVECYIEFTNLKLICDPKKVSVRYIAQLNGSAAVQDSRKWLILTLVTQFVKAAKDGVIMDTSNDGNPNAATQTEINKYILKALQGR